MLDYKRLTFVFIFLSIWLIATDTTTEKQARKSLLSFINIVAEEGGEVTENAPGSIVDSLESGRIATYKFFERNEREFALKSDTEHGYLSYFFVAVNYICTFFKLIANYVITFYPFIIFLVYSFFTSRFFRRDDFYSDYNTY